MSRENVEIVRRVFEHWERGDWSAGEDRQLFEDDCEVVFSTAGFPDAGVYSVGREALRAWSDFMEAFEELTFELDEIIDAGERVVTFAQLRGRGRASGADVDAMVGTVFTLREERIVRWELIGTDRQKALEAAGLQS